MEIDLSVIFNKMKASCPVNYAVSIKPSSDGILLHWRCEQNIKFHSYSVLISNMELCHYDGCIVDAIDKAKAEIKLTFNRHAK